LDIPKNNLNDTLTIGGRFEIFEKLYAPIDASAEISRCSLDMKTCEKLVNYNFKNICEKFIDPTVIYSKLAANIIPPISCPIKPGNYTAATTKIDLKEFSYFPLDGFIYTNLMKLITTNPVSKARKVVICSMMEFKIIKVRMNSDIQ
jgi:hypothetical protein